MLVLNQHSKTTFQRNRNNGQTQSALVKYAPSAGTLPNYIYVFMNSIACRNC